MGANVSVQLARGDGWATRRADGLLWTPAAERPDGLIEAFVGASDGGAGRAAVTAAVVDAGFEVAPFALVTWSDGLHVVVFGDVEVGTDAPSLPMVSGRRSRTWVEHRPAVDTATMASGEAADGGTELAAGTVRAGGFRLAVTARLPAAPPPVAAAPSSSPATTPPAPPPQPATVPAAPPTDPVSLLRSVTGGDWMDDSIGITGPALITAETTISPDDLLPATAAGDGEPSVRRPGGAIVIDGAVAAVFGEVAVVGRTPDVEAAGVDDGAVLCHVTSDPAVSRTHLVVRAVDGAMTVTDCGSRSGSVLERAGQEPVVMEPWTPYDVTADDALRLGGTTTLRIEH